MVVERILKIVLNPIPGPLKGLSLLFLFIFLMGCTRELNTPGSVHIKLNLPSYMGQSVSTPQHISTQSLGGWGLNDPSSLAQVRCYGVMVGGPDYDQITCNNESASPLFNVGLIIGAFPSSVSELSLDLKSGPKRKIYVIGFAATSEADCLNFSLMNRSYLSAPHIIGSAEKDLLTANESVSISISMNNAQKFDHCSSVILGDSPTIDTPLAILSSTPNTISNTSVLSVSVGGPNVITYKYKLGSASSTDCSNGTGYGSEIPIATQITDVLGTDDNYKLCVLGKDINEVWQVTATEYIWTKDTNPPSVPIISINGGVSYINTIGVALNITNPDANEMYITSTAGCSTGGVWEPFSTAKAWNLSGGDGPNYIYLKTRDAALNESSCASSSITLDTVAPSTPGTPTLGSVPNSLTETPTITWSNATDGTSGISSHEVGLFDTVGLIGSWVALSSGASLSGVSLVNGQQYKIKIRAIDNAGNVGTTAETPYWVAYYAMPAMYDSMALGDEHSCAIEGGSLKCWGSGSYGELGSGSNFMSLTAQFVNGGYSWSFVSAGKNSTCGITFTNEAYCWGSGVSGKLGYGGTGDQNVPTLVSGGLNWSTISIGTNHTCALDLSGSAYCWGANSDYQLGDGSGSMSSNPVSVSIAQTFSAIDVGEGFTCALSNASDIYCWGKNNFGNLGTGDTVFKTTPTLVNGSYSFTEMSVGKSHVCAIDTTGNLYCWGDGQYGALGDGGVTNQTEPYLISSSGGWTKIAAGSDFTCGIDAGTLKCWGINLYGELGIDSYVQQNTPTPINDVAMYTDVYVGSSHVCGKTVSSEIKCWGRNNMYQVGNTINTTDQPLPIYINP